MIRFFSVDDNSKPLRRSQTLLAVTAVTKQRGPMAFFRRDSKRSLPTLPKKQQANARVYPQVVPLETLRVFRQAKSVFEVASTQISNESVLTQRACHSRGSFQALLAGQLVQLKSISIYLQSHCRIRGLNGL